MTQYSSKDLKHSKVLSCEMPTGNCPLEKYVMVERDKALLLRSNVPLLLF